VLWHVVPNLSQTDVWNVNKPDSVLIYSSHGGQEKRCFSHRTRQVVVEAKLVGFVV